MPVKVGIVDSGIEADLAAAAEAQARMVLEAAGTVSLQASELDRLGHGSAIARLVLSRAPACRLLPAQVFAAGQPASALAVAAAIDWCVERGARIVNLSLGLFEDRAALRTSCQAAAARGVLLVASRAARGNPTYPAAYPEVLAVSGDARCAENEYTSIRTESFFAASPQPPAGYPCGGASYAAGRVSGLAAAFFTDHPAADVPSFLRHMNAIANYHGREQRRTTG